MPVIRWIFRIVAILFGLLVLLIGGVLALGSWRLERRIDRAPAPFAAAATTDSAAVARGRHIAAIVCSGCHGMRTGDMPLAGSRFSIIADSTGKGLGIVHAPNLTPGGETLKADDATLARAIREGIGRDGRPLMVMPSFPTLSDADLAALLAYLRSEPPVSHPTPKRKLGFMPLALVGAGVFPLGLQPATVANVPAVPEAADTTYGGYMVSLTACRECHGHDLRGMKPGPGPPPGPDIVTLARAHPFEAIDGAVRRGMAASSERPLSPAMPFDVYARMTDVEVRAIYEYLKTR